MTPKPEPPKDEVRNKIEQLILDAGYSWRGLDELAKEAAQDLAALIKLQQEALLKDIAKHQKFANDCELCTHNGNYLANKLRLELK